MKRAIAALFVMVVVPAAALAQTLADRLPADTFLYVGFKGSTALQREYEASNLKGMMQGTDLEVLVSDDFATGLARLAGQEDPEAAKRIPVIFSAIRQMWQYPTALAVRLDAEGKPELGLICQAGGSAAGLVQQLQSVVAPGEEMVVRQVGPYVLLTAGKAAAFEQRLSQANAGTIPAGLVQAMAQVDRDGAYVAYVDIQKWLSVMQGKSGRDAQQAMEALGLNKVNYAVMSGAFEGKGWRTRAFIAAPAPRTGLGKFLEGQAISADLLKVVPASAARVSVTSLDLAGVLANIREIAESVNPGASRNIDQGVTMLQGLTGVNVEKELLPALGESWVSYTDSSIGGVHPLSNIYVNKLRNPQQAEDALRKLESALVTRANEAAAHTPVHLSVVEKQYGQTKVHTLPLPAFAPSWAIQDGRLYLALYPQLVVSAAEFSRSGSKSFATGEVAASLSKAGAHSFTYTDLPQLAQAGYGNALLLSHYIGFAGLYGMATPTMPLPPLPVMQKHLGPSLSSSWTDANGWHLLHRGPFVGSQALGMAMTPDISMVQGPLAASILLPSLSRAREKANQVKCASNMRQIGQGIMLYTNDRIRQGGTYPDNLGELILEEQMSPDVFVCPSSRISVPSHLRSAKREQQAEWVNEHSPYVYLGKGLSSSSNPEFILMYEPMGDHQEGCNVLFADGHVEFLTPDGFDAAIEQAKEMGQQMPELSPF